MRNATCAKTETLKVSTSNDSSVYFLLWGIDLGRDGSTPGKELLNAFQNASIAATVIVFLIKMFP